MKEQKEFIHLEDIKRLLKRKKKKLIIAYGIGGFFVFFSLLSLPPHYLLKASFKEASAQAEIGSLSALKSMFQVPSLFEKNAQAATMMKSRALLQKVIGQEGLQVKVSEGGVLNHLGKRWKSFFVNKIGKQKNILPGCRCLDVLFSSTKPYVFSFTRISEDEIEYQEEGNIKTHCALTETIKLKEVEFHLEFQEPFIEKKIFHLTFFPMETVLNRLQRSLIIKSRREENSILDLAYKDTDGVRGVRFLNTLMQKYQEYLKTENERIAQEQLFYLKQRKEEVVRSLDDTLQKHANYLQATLEVEGFLGLSAELERIEKLQYGYEDKKLRLHSSMHHLDRMLKGGWLTFHEPLLGEEVQIKQQRLIALKREKQNLASSQLKTTPSLCFKKTTPHLQLFKQEQQRLINQSTLPSLYLSRDLAEKKIKKLSEQEPLVLEKEQLLEGMDLETLKQLHLQSLEKVELLSQRQAQVKRALRSLCEKHDELSAFAQSLEDELCTQLIKECSQISWDLKQTKYFSERDQLRLQEKLEAKKETLAKHLQSHYTLLQEKKKEETAQIARIQTMKTSLLGQEIEQIEEEISLQIVERKKILQEELEEIEQKIEALKIELQRVPKYWLVENKLQLQGEMHMGMMQGMSQLVESKNIEHHLAHIESKPIDLAYLPLEPKTYPAVIGFFIGGFFSFSLVGAAFIAKALSKGFPVSLSGIEYRGGLVAGTLTSADFKKNQETFYKIIEFLLEREKKHVALFLNNRSLEAQALIEVIKKQEPSCAFIYCYTKNETCGALQDFLADKINKEFFVKHCSKKHFALDAKEGSFFELLSKKKWQEAFSVLSQHHERIVIVSSSSLSLMENQLLAKQVDLKIVFLNEESFEDLAVYSNPSESTLFVDIVNKS